MDKYLTDKNFFRKPSTLRKCYINNFDALDTYWKKYLTYLNKLECFTKRYVVFQKEADNFKKKLLSNSCDEHSLHHVTNSIKSVQRLLNSLENDKSLSNLDESYQKSKERVQSLLFEHGCKLLPHMEYVHSRIQSLREFIKNCQEDIPKDFKSLLKNLEKLREDMKEHVKIAASSSTGYKKINVSATHSDSCYWSDDNMCTTPEEDNSLFDENEK